MRKILSLSDFYKSKIKINITAVYSFQQTNQILKKINKKTKVIISIFAGRMADSGKDPIYQFKESINLSDEVINFIASESKTNIRELIGVLNRIIAFSRVHNKVLTTNDCKNILKDVFNQIKVITVDKIQNVVSNYFNIPLSEMLSQRRSRPLARPRQIAMYLAKKLTTRSLPEIGRRFANRDHTTVIHAVKTITRLSEQDDEMKKNINQIKSLLLEQ